MFVSFRRQVRVAGILFLAARGALACDLSGLEERAKPFLLSDEEIQSRCQLSMKAEADRATVKDERGRTQQVSRCVFSYQRRRDAAKMLLEKEKGACAKAEAAAQTACSDSASQATCLENQRQLVADAGDAHAKLARGLDSLASDAEKGKKDHVTVGKKFLGDKAAIQRRVQQLEAAGQHQEAIRLLASPRMGN